jgi:[ribosomal protein S5]-alanine N-acetyltransferase
MRLESERMHLIPMNRQTMELSLSDRETALSSIGIISPGAEPLPDWMKNIYRIKIARMDDAPDAWLFSTYFVMVLKESGEPAGEIGFKGPPAEGKVEVGYGTREYHQGKGLMTEALRVLSQWTFSQRQHPVQTIIAHTEKDNAASQRVLEKAGFSRTGEEEGQDLWELNLDGFARPMKD